MPESELADFIGRKILAFDTETGLVEVGFTIPKIFLNMQGILHGGAYATMLDTACGVAIRSRLDMDLKEEQRRGSNTRRSIKRRERKQRTWEQSTLPIRRVPLELLT